MERLNLTKDFLISKLVHGYWRLTDWNLTDKEVLDLILKVKDIGITTVDHADIYGSLDLMLEKRLHPMAW